MVSAIERYECIMQPGYVVVSEAPTLICSVCGNGVVVTVWDRAKRVGGMIHCILPQAQNAESASNFHADVAISSVVSQLKRLNPYGPSFEAQLFGGGSLRGYREKMALKVIKVIKMILKRFGITIVAEDVGGSLGKKVVFDTYCGTTMVVKTTKIRKTDWAPEHLLQS